MNSICNRWFRLLGQKTRGINHYRRRIFRIRASTSTSCCSFVNRKTVKEASIFQSINESEGVEKEVSLLADFQSLSMNSFKKALN